MEIFGKDLHRLAPREMRQMAAMLIMLSNNTVIDQADIVRIDCELFLRVDDGKRVRLEQLELNVNYDMSGKALTFD